MRSDNQTDPTSGPWARLATSTARTAGDKVFQAWKRGLRKEHRENPDAVFDEAIEILADVGLVQRDADGLRVHAAAARYAPKAQLIEAQQAAPTLFDEDDS